jgi:hypothetical protein
VVVGVVRRRGVSGSVSSGEKRKKERKAVHKNHISSSIS